MANILQTDKQIAIIANLTVLHVGPVMSAAMAVRAAIAQEFRSGNPEEA